MLNDAGIIILQTESVGIAKQFTFTSSLQRMSVIVTRQESGGYNQTLYCKGAPEMIASLSQPDTGKMFFIGHRNSGQVTYKGC